MAWAKSLRDPVEFLKWFLRWIFLGTLVGAVGGLLGALFHHALHFVTEIRGEYPWLVFLLPAAGVLTVLWYQVLKLRRNRGTNEIIEAALDGGPVSLLVAPGIVGAACLTHLFGGSAGREGAALQLGGSVASGLARWFHLREENRKILVMAGMSAVFAGLFGTPLTAALFCMEFESVGIMFSPALLPCFLAAYAASRVSGLLGVHAEVFPLEEVYSLNFGNCWQYLALAVLVSLLGVAMCGAFHWAEHFAAHHVKHPMLRIALGGAVITVLTVLVGDQRFNGAGMDLALKACGGEADWYAFLLKLLFTAVTLAAGFKGGEIVPTFCIGATFGCVLGGILGMDAGFAAALGLIGLFCCATNSPVASMVLSVEMFGSGNLHLFALMCVICFTLSGNSGLYASQIIQFGKATRVGVPRE